MTAVFALIPRGFRSGGEETEVDMIFDTVVDALIRLYQQPQGNTNITNREDKPI